MKLPYQPYQLQYFCAHVNMMSWLSWFAQNLFERFLPKSNLRFCLKSFTYEHGKVFLLFFSNITWSAFFMKNFSPLSSFENDFPEKSSFSTTKKFVILCDLRWISTNHEFLNCPLQEMSWNIFESTPWILYCFDTSTLNWAIKSVIKVSSVVS